MRSRSPLDPAISNHCSPLLTALSGLTVARTRQALLYVLLENGRLASGDDPRLIDRKAQVVLDSGLAGVLAARDNRFELGGVQGCSKSLAAMAIRRPGACRY